ncbi:SPOR domain-containing protein [Dokdonella sp.]|uniref:SPOR domain-containing protein n=1 Tax=Dokdonella sp. TaxID=2291710 RepID=UPI00262FB450|nr:SPOR domain-containing protein [Dokdonella sp.]
MFVRALFLLLLALNIGGACWLAFAQRPQATPPANDPGVPRLVLLSERDGAGPLQNAELAGPAETPADRANDECRTIGPFPTQADLRTAMNALTPLTKRIQFHETRTTQTRGYWVYLPAMPTREQALATARALSAKGVRDYYVVTAGDQQNTISLGLFREPANAEKRRNEITALGFKPQTNTRTEDLPQYWIDLALLGDEPLDWRARLAAPRDVREEAIDCF